MIGPIAIVAPSGAYDPERLDAGVRILHALGVEARLVAPQQPHRYLADTDDARLAHLVDALTSPHWNGVWLARGGYGLTRLLDRIPWADVAPRPVVGFSDATPLLEALSRHTAATPVHGPVVHSLPVSDAASRQRAVDLLAGRSVGPLHGTAWRAGRAVGPLRGGNLAMLAATCGTPWQLDARGAILLLEDVGEAPYRIDRMLHQLGQAGVLDGVAGVALGTFTGCRVPDGADWSLDDVLRDHLLPLDVPVVAGLPVGHGSENAAFAVGATARLDDGVLDWPAASS